MSSAGSLRPVGFRFIRLQQDPNGIKGKFELSLCGSLLLFFSKEAVKPALPDLTNSSTIPAIGPMKINRIESNVLTLDYVDITIKGETRKNTYFYKASSTGCSSHSHFVGVSEEIVLIQIF